MTTRTSFVVKKLDFPPQIGDENRARRHNKAFLTSKWRRERGSSSKSGVFHFKMVTRLSLVVKIVQFSLQNGDEIESRRQKKEISAQKRRRE
ncbi:hypothetical protein NST89_03275 [Caldifermentibacillus hisashii]|uniref:hypothetical protein n=1 Tax=Caldifermentibacillus hisashii TaxID=996558 RepID=UPI003134C92D